MGKGTSKHTLPLASSAGRAFLRAVAAQEPVGLADEYHIFFGESHWDGGNLPRQAPKAALRAAKTGYLLRFSAASRRFKEFVGQGGLPRDEISNSFRTFILSPTNSSQFGIDGTTRALQPDALLKPALCNHRNPREGAALDHRLLAIAPA